MENEEINKYIAVEIMGLCWHEPKGHAYNDDGWGDLHVNCSKCGSRVRCDHKSVPNHPDYCSDSSPRSLLNEVIALVNETCTEEYSEALDECVPDDWNFEATALQIATACMKAHQEKTK